MRIYVDADSFPKAAKEILVRSALGLGVTVVFVANKPVRHEISRIDLNVIHQIAKSFKVSLNYEKLVIFPLKK